MTKKRIKALKIGFIIVVIAFMIIVTLLKYISSNQKDVGTFLEKLFIEDLATEYLGALISVLIFYGFLFAIGKSLDSLMNNESESELSDLKNEIGQFRNQIQNEISMLSGKIDSIAHEIKIIRPQNIESILEKGRQDTDFWYFNGGTGTYTKAVTLPSLSQRASNLGKNISIELLIINPFNNDICSLYAQLRASLRQNDKDSQKWTSSYVRNHSLATIVLCYSLCSQNTFLNISIGLKNHFSLFRFDISSNKVLITKEDPKELAMLFDRGSFTYDSYKSDFKQIFEQSQKVIRLNSLKKRIIIDSLDVEKVKFIMKELSLNPEISESDYSVIVELCKNYKSPYVPSAN